MTVGIVARGPLHTRFPSRRRECDVVIGINHAAALYPCDVFSFGDMETSQAVTPLASPRWFTNENAANRLRKRCVAVPADTVLWESLTGPPRVNWMVFSATAALVLAKHLGVTRILCFGVVDAEPQPDETERWRTERRIWQATVEWTGVEVIRA